MKTVLRMFLVVVITSLSCATVFCQSSGGGSSGGGSYPPAWPDPYNFIVNTIPHRAVPSGPETVPLGNGQLLISNVILRDSNSSNHNFTVQTSMYENACGGPPSMGQITSPVGAISQVESTHMWLSYGPVRNFEFAGPPYPTFPGVLPIGTVLQGQRYAQRLYGMTVVAIVNVSAPHMPGGVMPLTLAGTGAVLGTQYEGSRPYSVTYNGVN